MLQYYFCLNQISYLVACEHSLQHAEARSVLFIDPKRVRVQRRYQELDVRPFSRLAVTLCILRALIKRPAAAYVPHHRTGGLIQWLARMTRRTHLLDDGMDTLRSRPKNIDIHRLQHGAELLTFGDYQTLGQWTAPLKRVSVCQLAILQADDREALQVGTCSTAIVESPGVLARSGEVNPTGSLLYIAHPSRVKQIAAPQGAVLVRSDTHSIERGLSQFRGTVVIGESMVLPFLLLCVDPGQLRFEVELTAAQHDNLQSIHALLDRPDVLLRLH